MAFRFILARGGKRATRFASAISESENCDKQKTPYNGLVLNRNETVPNGHAKW